MSIFWQDGLVPKALPVIDMSNPVAYRNDWGGPSLFGVLLVHCGPGVVAAVAIAMFLIGRRASGRAQREQPGRP